MRRKALIINNLDNVAVALKSLDKGEVVEFSINNRTIKVMIKEFIAKGHKFAVRDISKGDTIVKYGEIVGIATRDIQAGEHVHIHNIRSKYSSIVKKR